MDEEGQRCLHSYLRFAHRKRAQQVREVEAAFDPATLASFGLEGAVFSAQDVHLILDNLKAEVTSMMQSELEHTYHTSGLMLQQLLRAGRVRLGVLVRRLCSEFIAALRCAPQLGSVLPTLASKRVGRRLPEGGCRGCRV